MKHSLGLTPIWGLEMGVDVLLFLQEGCSTWGQAPGR